MTKIDLKWSRLLIFSSEDILENIPSSAGIYRLSKKSADDKFYVFYVGKADNLREKLSTYLEGEGENQCLKERLKQKSTLAFRYAVVANKDIRNGAELFMYEYYAPECNLQRPEGSNGVDINLN